MLLIYFMLLFNLTVPHKTVDTRKPVAKASYAFKTNPQGGLVITLDGSNSQDPDGYIVGYEWTQIGSIPNVARIFEPSSAVTLVAPPLWQLGTYRFQLKVIDNQGAWNTTTVIISVVNESSDKPASGKG